MIRQIPISLNAAHPELPLQEATTFVGSPSAVFIRNVPKQVGNWHLTTVKVCATYPDNSAATVECVNGADGVYTATIPATTTSGRVTCGLQILADGLDERGEAVTGYVLGIADFAVFLRDMTISGAEGVKWYLHLLDARPATAKKGDAYINGTKLDIYDGTDWIEIGGSDYPPSGGIPKADLSSGVQASLEKADTALQTAPVTSVNSKTGMVTLTGADIAVSATDATKIDVALGGKVSKSGDTMTGPLTMDKSVIELKDATGYKRVLRCTGTDGDFYIDYYNSKGTLISSLDVPSASGILALTSDISVKSVKLNGTALTPDANGAVNVQAIATNASGSVIFPTFGGHYLVWDGRTLLVDGGPDANAYYFIPDSTDGYAVVRRQDLAGLAPLSSPAFTGTPTAPTPTSGDNSTKVATTAFVQDAMSGITPGPDNTKLNSTSAAPAFSSSATYAVGDYVTYEGDLYVCSTAITTAADWDSTKWTAANMTSPDATFDVTSQNALRLVDANGNRLWMQGYNLETPTVTSGAATLSNESVNYVELASTASADATVTLSLPARSTGKVSDFVLDVANKSSANTLTLSLDSNALDTTFGVVVPDGDDLTTMFTIAAGEMAEFYFTLTQFTKTPTGGSGSIPMYKIVKQVVVDATATQGA